MRTTATKTPTVMAAICHPFRPSDVIMEQVVPVKYSPETQVRQSPLTGLQVRQPVQEEHKVGTPPIENVSVVLQTTQVVVLRSKYSPPAQG